MAAGLGFKDFVTGEVLTAADVDGYLMQGVWVFASAAARDAAVTSPQEGNFAYLKDTNVTTYYTGSAWANLDTTGMTNPMTTTGDTIYSSSGSTPARLGIGTTGQVLTVAGGVPSWATSASGGMTLLSTTTLSGATTTISTISGSYTYLKMIIVGARNNTSLADFFLRINSDTATNYTSGYIYVNASSVQADAAIDKTAFSIGYGISNQTGVEKTVSVNAELHNYTNSSGGISFSGTCSTYANSSHTMSTFHEVYEQSAALTSLTFSTSGGNNFAAGTVYLYGVK